MHAQWKPKPQFNHKKQIILTICICIFTSILVNPYQNSHAQWKPKPLFTHKKNQFHYLHMHIHKHPCESIPKFTNMQLLSSILQVCISNLHAQCKPKPQFTHKKQINFTIFICIFTSILVNPTKIKIYENFVKYIARLHTTKTKFK